MKTNIKTLNHLLATSSTFMQFEVFIPLLVAEEYASSVDIEDISSIAKEMGTSIDVHISLLKIGEMVSRERDEEALVELWMEL